MRQSHLDESKIRNNKKLNKKYENTDKKRLNHGIKNENNLKKIYKISFEKKAWSNIQKNIYIK